MKVLPELQSLYNQLTHPADTTSKSKVQCWSGKGRGECLVKAIFSLFLIVISPFIVLYEGYKKDHKNYGWKALDLTLSACVAPIVCTVNVIQGFAGAIIHPKLFLTLQANKR